MSAHRPYKSLLYFLFTQCMSVRYNVPAPVVKYGMALRSNLQVPGSIPGR